MKSISTIGVVGAGTMGSAIAQHFAMKGLAVVLVDRTDEYVSRGLGYIRETLEEAEKRRIVGDEDRDEILARIHCSTNLADLGQVPMVVEAVFEDLEVKKQLFKDLEAVVSDDCVLASNTSSFLVTDIARILKHPERVVGVHYFYHAAKNKLVEIIPGEKTDPQIVSDLENFYSLCGKIPIVVKDAPGFAVNRFFVPWLNEGARLYEEGAGSIAFIDKTAREVFGVGMGPFGLMNATGVPIARHAAQGLADNLCAFYSPAEILSKQVDAGMGWDLDDETVLRGGKNNEELIRERLVGVALGVAAQMVSEAAVDATSADLGARTGLRWPLGPFELMNKLGVENVKRMVTSVFEPWNMATPEFPFSTCSAVPLEWVQQKTFRKSGFIIFNIPDRMNALDEEVMAQLDICIESLNARTDIEKIFILGKGKAFIAGANIKFFLEAMAANDLARIQTFTEFGQKVLNKISGSTKATYAYLDGLTLGGGLELALACDHRIATVNAALAFPETGIGIYPGLGGTQRAPRLIGKGLAKMLIATGQFVKAEKALAFGLVDALIDPVFDLNELDGFSIEHPRSGKHETSETEQAFSKFDGVIDDELFQNTVFEVYEKQLRAKAPIALKTAMSLVDQGEELSLSPALDLELRGLKQIFSTSDAQAGLTSVLAGKRPEFNGS
jgi:enoyl-CoA hydratase / 3-hydroxyacyl-CoA dehydrogenase